MVTNQAKRAWITLTLLTLIINAAVAVKPINSHTLPAKDDSSKKANEPSRVYTTTRLTTAKPVVDGNLNDACWETGTWAGDFVQWIPNEGAPASQQTKLKILYDDENVYVAIRAFDNEPSKIQRRAGRRDEFQGDMVGVCFDSYHDHRTGFEFDLSAYGQKADVLLTNPWDTDFNWNAVWTGKVGMEDSAWVAEMEIPLSQLRYSNETDQVWGLHCWRWINRLQEESDWEPQSSTSPGMLYLFGELRGISGLQKSRGFEIMPYAVGKLNTFEKQQGNPFTEDGRSWSGTVGADAKIGISSNFTMNLTVNPDFGQVEADPSVMNLTAFETYYDEKRPFFLEGKNIFDYSLDDMILFYSRRIGHAPTYTPEINSDEYLKMPDNTTILDALKISGKTAGGFSMGMLQSFTSSENAIISTGDENSRKETVEPYTNYMVGRVQQDYKQGNTVIGGIFTSTNRFIKEESLSFMNRAAYTGGVDLLHQWQDKKYFVDAKFIGSYVAGDETAILNLQRSSARYYQRPDADYLELDSTRTYLAGSAGSIKIGRKSKGLWRYSTGIGWFSPGLELNDIGYMQTTDIIRQTNQVSYFVNKPVSVFRTYSVGFDQGNHWDFGGRYLVSDFELETRFEFRKKWVIAVHPGFQTQSLDTRLLRGGEAMLIPPSWRVYVSANTDYAKMIYFGLDGSFQQSTEKSSRDFDISPGIIFRPVNTLKLVAGLSYSYHYDQLQYIETVDYQMKKQYILGTIDQNTLGLQFRIDYSITPELSVQYYGSPFVSRGLFSEYKAVTDALSDEYSSRFAVFTNPVKMNDSIFFDENNDAVPDYSVSDPDFNFLQFRSNLVARWEYRPGSVIYLVWSMDKTGSAEPLDAALGESMKQFGNIHPNNIFLVKFSYWFSL
ncbi:MAG: hypothetical protein H6Q21_1561 [Bacteroidetes bacterium]|nr:hypothetical protein [Bacteroidota bacterium]